MRIVIQRVTKANCVVNNVVVGNIDKGYLLLVGFTNGDDKKTIKKAVKKVLSLRIFDDEFGKMNLNLAQVQGSILSISQFTLYGNAIDSNRPSFTEALNYNDSKDLYDFFNQSLIDEVRNNDLYKNEKFILQKGVFGEHMYLNFTNDGPVTISLEF